MMQAYGRTSTLLLCTWTVVMPLSPATAAPGGVPRVAWSMYEACRPLLLPLFFLFSPPPTPSSQYPGGKFVGRANCCLRPFIDHLIITLFQASATLQSFPRSLIP